MTTEKDKAEDVSPEEAVEALKTSVDAGLWDDLEAEKATSFLRRVRERTAPDLAALRTKAFQEFFTLTAQINETAHGLSIKSALLDVENGEVTVTYKTRALKKPELVAEPGPVEAAA